jgi:very-short-patch-repair endonuclease
MMSYGKPFLERVISMSDKVDIENLKKTLGKYRSRLIDRSRRNPLVNISLNTGRGSNVHIISADIEYLCKRLPTGIEIKPAIQQLSVSNSMAVSNQLNLEKTNPGTAFHSNLNAGELDRNLSKLARDAKTKQADTGVNPLSCVIGLLKWRESPSSQAWYHTPIMTVPVSISREPDETRNRYQTIIKSVDQDPEVNQNLVELLKSNGYILPLQNENENIVQYFERLKIEMAKQNFDVIIKVIITMLPAGRLSMWQDLEPEAWPANILTGKEFLGTLLNAAPLSGNIIDCAGDYDVEKMYEQGKGMPKLIYDADSSQISALIDVSDGHSLAIEGPPGTGKSQTIANMIANAVEQRKKVLFIAEKQAALDVVASRLRKRGFGPLIFELHSDTATRTSAMNQIKLRAAERPKKLQEDPVISRVHQKTHLDLRERAFFAGTKVIGDRDLNAVLWRIAYLKSEMNKIRPTLASEVPALESGLPESNLKDVSKVIQDHANLLNETGLDKDDPWAGVNISSDVDPGTVQLWSGRLADSLEKLEDLLAKLPNEVRNSLEGNSDEILSVAKRLAEADGAFTLQGKELLEAIPHQEENERIKRDHNRYLKVKFKVDNISPNLVDIGLDEIRKLYADLRSVGTRSISKAATVKEKLRQELEKLESPLSKLDPIISSLENDSPFNIYRTLQHISELSSGRSEGFSDEILTLVSQQVDNELKKLRDRKNEIEEIYKRHFKDVFSDKASKTITSLAAGIENDLSIIANPGIFKGLNRKYKDACDRLNSHLRIQGKSAGDLQEIYKNAIEAYDQYDDLNTREFYPPWFPEELFNGDKTDIDVIIREIAEARRIEEILREMSLRGYSNLDKRLYDIANNKELHEASALLNDNLEKHRSAREQFSEISIRLDKIQKIIKDYQNFPHDIEVTEEVINIIEDFYDSQKEVERHGIFSIELVEKQIIETKKFTNLALPNGLEKYILKSNNINLTIGNLAALITKIAESMNEIIENNNRLNRVLGTNDDELENILGETYNEQLRRLRGLADPDNTKRFDRARNLTRITNKATSEGVGEIAERLLKEGIPVETIGHAYEYDVLITALRQHPNMVKMLESQESVTSGHGDDLTKVFRTLDEKVHEINAQNIVRQTIENASLPEGNSSGYGLTEAGLINKIVNGGSKISIRNLVDKAGVSLREMMPIWLMSPSTVAQMLTQNYQFDLVIIDEASQMRPENALGSLLRAKQVVIVGDRRQMPPNKAFEINQDDEETEETDEVPESILDLANERLSRRRRLSWHYRSRHKALIDFSNKEYYDRKLIYFPSAKTSDITLGVHSHYVADGQCEGNINMKEAEEVAIGAVLLASRYPEKSIGIVSLNSKQAELISRILEEFALSDNSLHSQMQRKDEPLIIRNLENIQGDERDIILISTGYSSNGGSYASQLLKSPIINRADGYRRLNVLFTRARLAVHLFTSMRPSEIRLSGKGHRAVDDLKKYLIYAENNQIAEIHDTRREPDSDFERVVGEAIRDAGFQVDHQIGVDQYWVDLGIKHPSYPYGYIAGVECDGAPWHRGLAVRDRDRIRQAVLEGMGWHIIRQWSTDWYRNPVGEAKKIIQQLQERLETLQETLEDEEDLDEKPEGGKEYINNNETSVRHTLARLRKTIFGTNIVTNEIREGHKEVVQTRDDLNEPKLIADVTATSGKVLSSSLNPVEIENEDQFSDKVLLNDVDQEEISNASIATNDKTFSSDDENVIQFPKNFQTFDEVKPNRPFNSNWKKCTTVRGDIFYETIKYREYIIWKENIGVVATIYEHNDPLFSRKKEFKVIIEDETQGRQEYHASNLYEAVYWAKKQTENNNEMSRDESLY